MDESHEEEVYPNESHEEGNKHSGGSHEEGNKHSGESHEEEEHSDESPEDGRTYQGCGCLTV